MAKAGRTRQRGPLREAMCERDELLDEMRAAGLAGGDRA